MASKDMSGGDDQLTVACQGFLALIRGGPSLMEEYRKAVDTLDAKRASIQADLNRIGEILTNKIADVNAEADAQRTRLATETATLKSSLERETEAAQMALGVAKMELLDMRHHYEDEQVKVKSELVAAQAKKNQALAEGKDQLMQLDHAIRQARADKQALIDDLAALKKKWSA